MKRIVVLGCSGAGKSTLARELGGQLGLPVVHLDREFWLPGWVEPDKSAWAARVDALVAGERWITDGNFNTASGTRFANCDKTLMTLEEGRARGKTVHVLRGRADVRRFLAGLHHQRPADAAQTAPAC